MGNIYIEIMLAVAILGCAGLDIKAADMIIGIMLNKYRTSFFKAGHPTSINFWDPIQGLINFFFTWKLLLRGNYIDKNNQELNKLIFWHRFYFILSGLLLILFEILY